jgi:hypothetical protein
MNEMTFFGAMLGSKSYFESIGEDWSSFDTAKKLKLGAFAYVNALNESRSNGGWTTLAKKGNNWYGIKYTRYSKNRGVTQSLPLKDKYGETHQWEIHPGGVEASVEQFWKFIHKPVNNKRYFNMMAYLLSDTNNGKSFELINAILQVSISGYAGFRAALGRVRMFDSCYRNTSEDKVVTSNSSMNFNLGELQRKVVGIPETTSIPDAMEWETEDYGRTVLGIVWANSQEVINGVRSKGTIKVDIADRTKFRIIPQSRTKIDQRKSVTENSYAIAIDDVAMWRDRVQRVVDAAQVDFRKWRSHICSLVDLKKYTPKGRRSGQHNLSIMIEQLFNGLVEDSMCDPKYKPTKATLPEKEDYARAADSSSQSAVSAGGKPIVSSETEKMDNFIPLCFAMFGL